MERQIQAYCRRHNIILDKQDMLDGDKVQLSYVRDKNGDKIYHIQNWNLPISKPSLEELNSIDDLELNRMEMLMKVRRLRQNPMFPVIKEICDELNLDLDSIIKNVVK